MGSSQTAAWIEERVHAELSPVRVDVLDESAAHAGHAGARSGGGHFAVTIVAGRFEGMDRLERHRLIYAILAERMHTGIHALSLSLHTPEEWARLAPSA